MPKLERKRKFTTTAPSEVSNLVWKVENFNKLVELKEVLETVTLKFEAGHTIQMPSEWKFLFCIEDIEEDKLGVYLCLRSAPKDCKELFVKFDIVIKHSDGSVYKRVPFDSKKPEDMKTLNGYGWSLEESFTPLSEFLHINAQKGDESVILEIRFELFNFENIVEPTFTEDNQDLISKLTRFEEKSSQAILSNYHQLLIQGENSDFLIVTKDGKNFPVHRSVIAAQSPVFNSMLQTKMTEASSGTVLIEDLTSEAMDVLLKFMYSGRLIFSDGIAVIDQLVYAAEKYELTLLKDFCDEILIEAVTVQNSSDMLKLARKFSLKMAEKGIVDYISKNIKEVLKNTVFL